MWPMTVGFLALTDKTAYMKAFTSFRWRGTSALCKLFTDLNLEKIEVSSEQDSRWFTFGWTLIINISFSPSSDWKSPGVRWFTSRRILSLSQGIPCSLSALQMSTSRNWDVSWSRKSEMILFAKLAMNSCKHLKVTQSNTDVLMWKKRLRHC